MKPTDALRAMLRPAARAARSIRGAIDLASIMVGVLVIGVLAGIIAVAVFVVIPWAQNEAARGNVATVLTAEGVSKAQDGAYRPMADLVARDRLPATTSVTAVVDEKGTCYIAIAKSDAGPLFFGTEAGPQIEVLTRDTASSCATTTSIEDAVESIGGWDELGVDAPKITRADFPAGTKGASYSEALSWSGDVDVFSVSSGELPGGLDLDPASGVVGGVPTAAGSFNFSLNAKNSGGSSSVAYSMSVVEVAPTITSSSLPNATQGEPYSALLAGTGDDVLFYIAATSTLPSGITINTATGELSGTPTNIGATTFTVTKANSGGSVSATLTLDVKLAETSASAFTWSVTGSKATITGYTGASKDVVIPAKYTTGGATYDVATIASRAFQSKGLTSVVIPDSVSTMDWDAFSYNELTSVRIPSGVTTLSDYVFSNNRLASIVIPSTVTRIGYESLSYNQLTSVVVPDSVTFMSVGSFRDNLLASVTLSKNLTTMQSNAFLNNQLTSVVIPSKLATIGGSVFQNNKLTSVTIPSGVVTIHNYAFSDNPLTKVFMEGNAPTISAATVFASFGPAAGKTVHYRAGATGFGNPWQGYATTTY